MQQPSLKTRVRDAISEESHFAARLFDRTFFHPTREHEPTKLQLVCDLNKYWRKELGLLSIDTMQARSALVDTDDVEYWLRSFHDNVIGTITTAWVTASRGGKK